MTDKHSTQGCAISTVHFLRTRAFASAFWCRLLLIALPVFALPPLALAQLKISVTGLEGEPKDNVLLHLSKWDQLPSDDEDATRRALHKAVRSALQPYGYYEPQLRSQWHGQQLALDITPGPVIRWGQSDIRVPPPETALPNHVAKLIQAPPFSPGEPIKHTTYDQYKKELLLQIRQLGYLDAAWEVSRLRIDVEAEQATVVLHMTLGARYRISRIDIQGSTLSEKTARQLVATQEGDWYSAEKIGIIYENLLSSGYFKNAEIEVINEPPDQAALLIQLEDQPKDQFTTGIGYGTDTGMRGKLGWTRSKVNQRGDDIYSNIQVSQIGEEITAQYHIPWPHPLERYLSLEAGWKREETTDRESSVLTTGVALKRSKRKQWQYSVGINLENETYRQGDNPEETVTYLLPNYHFIERLLFGDPRNPTTILKYWFDTSLGFNVLAAENTLFLSTEIGATLTWNINETHAIAPRFELGGIMTDDIYSVPLSKRFYTGGDQTVRGFKYNSLAPEDDSGDLIGGQFLNVFSLEYQYSLNEEWKLATFVDTGRTFISSHDPFHSGAGVGLRWVLPVGTFSFDVAKPVTGEDDNKPRVHIYVGMLL